jgi:hypothetical protein
VQASALEGLAGGTRVDPRVRGVCACRGARTEAERPPICEEELFYGYSRSHVTEDAYAVDAEAAGARLAERRRRAESAAAMSRAAEQRARAAFRLVKQ